MFFPSNPLTLPEMSMTIGKRTEIQEKKHMMKVLLKDLGLHETLTYSLTSPSLVHDFNIFHDQEPVKLAIARFCNSTPFEYVVDNSY